ncbi:hypothetical protein SAMN05192529_10125 [Arachidicoccus rhizosphaerae]|uniref:N-acetyltransferase domain-containing protein n=1 Tax=Arachidicoccus rhizosphaerae TaxID=551991 RepID=A0A1H3VGG6_9BACT|nr:GNAT family N-acetyltransferase [Arachidicoccus rhizosphaerae]SDZ73278.1 hypothetical protein SAMN05192529_10125 [Arachidicoccus rhizosphaerae]
MEKTAVVLQDNGSGQISLYSDEQKAGFMEISVDLDQHLLTVYHTEVEEQYNGRGFGKLLLEALVQYSRNNQLRVRPLCPFVHAQFKRHEEKYQDIWYKEH